MKKEKPESGSLSEGLELLKIGYAILLCIVFAVPIILGLTIVHFGGKM